MKNDCVLIKFTPAKKTSPETEAFLEQIFEVISLNNTDDGLEELVCYARADFNIQTLEESAKTQHINLPPYTVEKQRESDWLSPETGGFEPLYTNMFCISSALKPAPRTKKILLSVNAATAFGSTHQTTRLCLKEMENLYKKGFCPKKVLDMGTGSGILAMAAAKLWKKENLEVVASDIDPEAVRVAKQNLKVNGVAQNVSVVLGNGFNAPKVIKHALYDLILANILARSLREMAPALSAALKKEGLAVVSGFVDNQIEWVAEIYRPLGFKVLKTASMDCWHALLLEKIK